MTSVEQLYGELWADDGGIRTELEQSLDPRPSSALYDAFAALGPQPRDLYVLVRPAA
jgi:hypothetical protein